MAETLEGAVTLPFLTVLGRIGDIDYWAVGHTQLPLRVKPRVRVRVRGAIYNMTGTVRANGCAIFCFVGPPDRVVEWRVASGAGLLYSYHDYTDQWGRASCQYVANGYSGLLTIEVRYGS